MNRAGSRVGRIGLGLVAAATLLHTGPADAQAPPAPSLAGYEGVASASGVHAMYNPSGLLPLAAPVDLGAPDALATIASGPSTFARASTADPGDLLANPDALLQAGGQPAGTVPAYPYRITASNGVGEPSSELAPAPGLDSRVAADDTGSSARSTMPQLGAPAVLTAGASSSAASTATDGSTVSLHARSSISGLDLLGILTIESVVTELTATADGATATVAGGTVVTGARLLGQPVTIDSSGIQPAEGSGSGPNPGVGALDGALQALGIRVTVASPVQQAAETAGQLAAAGLRIDFELSDRTFPVLGEVLDVLPPLEPVAPGAPGGDDLLAVVQARHLVSIHVAGASVSVSARPTAPRRAAATTPAPTPAAPSAATPTPATPARAGVAAAPAPASLVGAAPAVATPADAPEVSLAQGIGVLAILALLAQPFLGDLLSRGAALLTTAGPTEACPREGT